MKNLFVKCDSFLALKYTWEISETSLAFLDIKVSIRGNVLCTSVHYKPTDSHSYLLYSSAIRFWHIALIVILIILREKEFCAHRIW